MFNSELIKRVNDKKGWKKSYTLITTVDECDGRADKKAHLAILLS